MLCGACQVKPRTDSAASFFSTNRNEVVTIETSNFYLLTLEQNGNFSRDNCVVGIFIVNIDIKIEN